MTKARFKLTAAQALEILEQAWSYYTPERDVKTDRTPELFEYANAA
ncbi:MAG: hypothetical protein HRU31_01680 [Rhodobacteraceae bacterium]|nr:hypothetical protein [Paracoccaceae bacterium]